jgi:PST family polysaccharide transporter
MGTERSHASRSLLWSGVDTFSQTGFSILAMVFLARLVGPRGIGEGALAVAFAQLASLPFELLFHDALIQRAELEPRHKSTALTVTLCGSVGGAALLWGMAPYLAQLYGNPALAGLVRVAALAGPVAAAAAVASALLRRDLAFAPLARRTLVGRLLGLGIGVSTSAFGGGAWSLVAMYLGSTVLSAVVLFASRGLPALRFSATALHELSRFALPNMLAQMLLLGNSRIFIALSGLYLDQLALGWLSLAFRMVEELRNTLSSAAAQLALPLLSRRKDAPAQFTTVFSEATALTSCILMPLYAGIAVTASDLMTVAFGPAWRPASGAVTILALAAVIVTTRQYTSIAVNAVGRAGLNAKVNGLVFAVSVALLLTGVVRTVELAATVWAVRALVLSVASIWSTRIATRLSIRAQLGPSAAAMVSALLMSAAVLTLRDVFLAGESSAVRLATCAVAGAAAYGAALALVAPQVLRKLADFMHSALLPGRVRAG